MRLLFHFLLLLCITGCDSTQQFNPEIAQEDETIQEEAPTSIDYFPLQVGNKWTYSMNFIRSESFPTNVEVDVSQINVTGELTWEVISEETTSDGQIFLLEETFHGIEKNRWFCRGLNPPCPVEEPLEKEVASSWIDTLRVVSARDSLWFNYENGDPEPPRIPFVSYPLPIPYATPYKLHLPRFREEQSDTTSFFSILRYPRSGNLVKDIGMINLTVSCDFLASNRVNACNYEAQLIDYKFLNEIQAGKSASLLPAKNGGF